ncbi:MAG: hypothetical protein JSS77_16145 [Acidobacteria bacterium]|nr:hypothetical protein [Acidobacteriota bacterium]
MSNHPKERQRVLAAFRDAIEMTRGPRGGKLALGQTVIHASSGKESLTAQGATLTMHGSQIVRWESAVKEGHQTLRVWINPAGWGHSSTTRERINEALDALGIKASLYTIGGELRAGGKVIQDNAWTQVHPYCNGLDTAPSSRAIRKHNADAFILSRFVWNTWKIRSIAPASRNGMADPFSFVVRAFRSNIAADGGGRTMLVLQVDEKGRPKADPIYVHQDFRNPIGG